MRVSAITIIAGAVAVNAAALPEPNWPTTKSTWGETTTSSAWGKPTTTSKPWGEPSPTGKPPGGKPTCGSGETPVTCSSVGLLNALNCVNILTGNTISVPISILSERDVEVEARGDKPEAGDYCCKSAGLLNLLNCVNVADGNTITIPISIL